MKWTRQIDLTTVHERDRRKAAWATHVPPGASVRVVVGRNAGPYGNFDTYETPRGENHRVIDAVLAMLDAGIHVDIVGSPDALTAWGEAIAWHRGK
ncbi:hypothetical protein SAMN05216561_11541 [Nocardioides psychrotolerans]|uniref:Uncharacterized protein n=1 Tax=Nocardioides psychrotolerans TaxID=1005945 RepID=A0A1I3MC10_9ACTN|nr:hypothetical protein SAMN05216561_11541 [Nocardioides psychrotolerans]